MSPRIETRQATLRYGDVTAVDGLSMTLEGPGICGLLGRNGSGKTTLLSMLAAFRPPSSGGVLLDGEPVFENANATSRVCLIRAPVDTVDHLWPDNKVRDALDFATRSRPGFDEALAAKLADRFDLPLRADVRALSKGQRSALGITLGLASRAPITLFDEAYLGMDAPSRYAFYDELLADYIACPRLVVISTHHIDELARLLDDVVIIDEGRLVVHERKEALEARGVTVIGPADAVDRFAAGKDLLAERTLGPTKSAALYGDLGPDDVTCARAAGLELGPLPLQDLFVHMTARNGGRQ